MDDAIVTDASHQTLFWSVHLLVALFGLQWLSYSHSNSASSTDLIGPILLATSLFLIIVFSDLHWSNPVYGSWFHLLDSVVASSAICLHGLHAATAHSNIYPHMQALTIWLLFAMLGTVSYLLGWYFHGVKKNVAAGFWCHVVFRSMAFCGVYHANTLSVPDEVVMDLRERLGGQWLWGNGSVLRWGSTSGLSSADVSILPSPTASDSPTSWNVENTHEAIQLFWLELGILYQMFYFGICFVLFETFLARGRRKAVGESGKDKAE